MTPLHTIGNFIRELLLEVPLPAVRMLFVALPAALLIWVLTLPREATTSPDGAGRWDQNLKIGAAFALLMQIVIYCLF